MLGLLVLVLGTPPIDCQIAAQKAADRVLTAPAAQAHARLATAPAPDANPGLQVRARGGFPRPNTFDRAGLRLTLPPPGTAAAHAAVGQAVATVDRADRAVAAVRASAAARRAHLGVRQAEAALADAQTLHAIAIRRAALRQRQAKAGVVSGLKALQAGLEIEAAQDAISAAKMQIAAARAELSRWTGHDDVQGRCTPATAPTQHPEVALIEARTGVLKSRAHRDTLGVDLWPDFVEAAWDTDGEGSRGLVSLGVDIPFAQSNRADLADALLRARAAEVNANVAAQVTAAQTRLAGAQAHLIALDRPLPADVQAAAKHDTLDGLAIREAIQRAQARRRDAAWAVEAAQIDLMEAQGVSTP